MIVYTRPLYHDLPQRAYGAWPVVVTAQPSEETGRTTWTLIYATGEHMVVEGLAARRAVDPLLTTDILDMHYLRSVERTTRGGK